MAFVKLDCGMLDSTIWVDREAREIFITALLMAVPLELSEPTEQLEVSSLNEAGYTIPPGWYGFVPAAGPGIVRRAGLEKDSGLAALVRLCSPEDESRTPDHGGRRMARIDGGYIILNFDKYRQKDHSNAERQKRFRERRRNSVTGAHNAVTSRNVTEAEADAEADKDIFGEIAPTADLAANSGYPQFEDFWALYPKKTGKGAAEKSWSKINPTERPQILEALDKQIKARAFSDDKNYIPHPATWLNQKRWLDEIITRKPNGKTTTNIRIAANCAANSGTHNAGKARNY